MKSFFAFAILLPVLAFAQSGEVPGLIAKGDALDKQLKTADALAVYLEADQLQPNDAEILHRLAKQCGLSMDDVSAKADKIAAGRRALDYSQRAIAADPKNAKAHLALAISYGRLAPLLESKTKIAYSKLVKEEADRALALDANDDLTLHVLGAWNYEMANLNVLLRSIAQLIYGKFPAASNEEAARLFKKAAAMAPNRVMHHIELGRTYAAMGQEDLAKAELEKGLRLPSREKDDEETKRRGRAALKSL